MLILNNQKMMHDQRFRWISKQDHSESGSVIYPRGTKIPFKGGIFENKTVLAKLFTDSIERDNLTLVIETVAQFPFAKDDVIEDDNGKKYVLTAIRYQDTPSQHRFLKSGFTSKKWYLGVEGDE